MVRKSSFTKPPNGRTDIQNHSVDIRLKDPENLAVGIKINLGGYYFEDDMIVFLEAHDKYNLERFNLGSISHLKTQTEGLNRELSAFDKNNPQRIKFRLKIINGLNSRLVGFAENIKINNLNKSLLPVKVDKNLTSIIKVDWSDGDFEPKLLYNHKITQDQFNILTPLIVEFVFKEIAFKIIQNNTPEEQEWFDILKEFIDFDSIEDNPEELHSLVGQGAEKFAKKHKLVNSLRKRLGKP